MSKILFLGTKSFSAKNFRLNLFKLLIEKDFDVYCACTDREYEKEIKESGAHFILVKFNNRSINPFSFFPLIKKYVKVMKTINPDIVFTYQLKPNLFGPIAAKKCKINNVISFNEGLGDAFYINSFFSHIKKSVALKLHKLSFNKIKQLIVLNENDCEFFVKHKIISRDKISIIHGVGIDINKFSFCKSFPKENNVLMISRLVKNKGIFDYCKVAEEVKKTDSSINFKLIGPEQELLKSDLSFYIDNKIITYLGEKHDVRNYIENSRIVLLLSYQEGFGLSLAEAMSMGRPVISYKNSGTKIVIDDNLNGFLFDTHNIHEVASKILEIIDDNSLLTQLALNGRKKVENEFESNHINNLFLECIIKNIK